MKKRFCHLCKDEIKVMTPPVGRKNGKTFQFCCEIHLGEWEKGKNAAN